MTPRDQLVADNLGLVRGIAAKLKVGVGKTLEFDDLVAYGTKGLLEAADRFDAAQGASFPTFAYYRIRGAMLDGLRTMGWYSRAEYARYKAEERATEYLRNVAEREAAAPEGPEPDKAQQLESIAEILGGVGAIHLTSLEAAEHVEDDRLAPPDAHLTSVQLTARMHGALARLPEKERQLIQAYYFQDKNLEQAGAELGLSKSWTCRLHARAVGLLRDALGDDA